MPLFRFGRTKEEHQAADAVVQNALAHLNLVLRELSQTLDSVEIKKRKGVQVHD